MNGKKTIIPTEANPETGQDIGEEVTKTSEVIKVAEHTIEKVKNALLNPREISKKLDASGRKTISKDISEARKLRKSAAQKRTEQEEILQIKESESKNLESQRINKISAFEQRLKTLVARLKKALRIKDKTAIQLNIEIASIESDIEELTAESEQVRQELERLVNEQTALPDPQKMLEAYYERIESTPFSNEEKRGILTPDFLATLSTEEYLKLWRRLNPYFLTHVTGQGFRDHYATWSHQAGMDEFCDGFGDILRDDKLLRSPLGIRLRSRDKQSIKAFLDGWVLEAENEEEAIQRLNRELNATLATAPSYPDKTAVHFATQLVADNYYGGERNNEIFFVYPSDVIASQFDFAFNGDEKDFTKPQSETAWNDVFVWPLIPDKPGIPLDSGIAFLPKNTPVDPNTGSKYASVIKKVDGKDMRVMVENEELVTAFADWAEKLDNKSPVIQAYINLNENEKRYYYNKQQYERECRDVFHSEIIKLGFSEEQAIDITNKLFSSTDGINQFQYDGYLGDGKISGKSKKEVAIRQLKAASANWKRADNPIPAQEYWDKYFKQHPEHKPKHIIYYDGNPTNAIYKFLQENNIGKADVSKKEGELLGFDDRHITDMRKDPRARRGYDELEKDAHEVIHEHYTQK